MWSQANDILSLDLKNMGVCNSREEPVEIYIKWLKWDYGYGNYGSVVAPKVGYYRNRLVGKGRSAEAALKSLKKLCESNGVVSPKYDEKAKKYYCGFWETGRGESRYCTVFFEERNGTWIAWTYYRPMT